MQIGSCVASAVVGTEGNSLLLLINTSLWHTWNHHYAPFSPTALHGTLNHHARIPSEASSLVFSRPFRRVTTPNTSPSRQGGSQGWGRAACGPCCSTGMNQPRPRRPEPTPPSPPSVANLHRTPQPHGFPPTRALAHAHTLLLFTATLQAGGGQAGHKHVQAHKST